MPPNARSIFAVHHVHPVPISRRLDLFQRHVTASLSALSTSPSADLLSLPWLHSLLDSLLQIHHQFVVTLRSFLHPQASNLLTNYYATTVKALDIITAVRDGIDRTRRWKNQADITTSAAENSQAVRLRKSLLNLTASMQEEDPERLTVRPFRSFKQTKNSSSSGSELKWSASKQLQAMAVSLSARSDAAGLAGMVYTMGSVIMFAMWVLVEAVVPCQVHVHYSVGKGFGWSGAVLSMYDRVMEESKTRRRRRRRGWRSGLMREVGVVDKCRRRLMDLTEGGGEIREEVEELKAVCEGLERGLEGLETRVRGVFHGIVESRSEGLQYLRNIINSQ